MAREIILQKSTFDFVDSGEGYYSWSGELAVNFEDNETYYIIWDGVEHSCVATTTEDGIVLGNLAILNSGDDTEEPFLITLTSTDVTIATTDIDSSHTITIQREKVENIVIKNPLGKSVMYGSYNHVLLNNVDGTKTLYSKIPDITNEEDGKVLSIKDGGMSWEVASGGEVNWDDILDEAVDNNNDGEPIITRNIKYELLPKHLQFGEKNDTITFIDGTYKATYYADNSQWSYDPVPIISDNHLEPDKIYTVEWNGNEYTCMAQIIETYSIIAVGNLAIAGMGEDTGEPFAIAEDLQGLWYGEPAFVVMSTDVNNIDTTVTTEITSDIKMTCEGLIIEKIDKKYLPSTLPEVTTSDVGKFLRVGVDGIWIAESLPNAEEASF